MSIQYLRDGPLSVRQNDRALSQSRRRSRLRDLNTVTAIITQHIGIPLSLKTPLPLTNDEIKYLDENDIEKGRYFQDTSLPVTLEALENATIKTVAFKQPATPQIPSEEASYTHAIVAPASPQTADSHPESSAAIDVVPKHIDHPKSLLEPNQLDNTNEVFQSHGASSSSGAKVALDSNMGRTEAETTKVGNEQPPGHSQGQTPEPDTGPPHALLSAPHPTSEPSAVAQDVSPVMTEGTETASRTDGTLDSTTLELDTSTETGPVARKEHADEMAKRKDAARREMIGDDLVSPDVQLRLEQEQAVRATRDAPAAVSKSLANVEPTSTPNTASPMAPPDRQSNAPGSDQQQLMDRSVLSTPKDKLVSPEPPSRMRTRVSTGALRQKSVSEIISESHKNTFSTPKATETLAQDVSAARLTPSKSINASKSLPAVVPDEIPQRSRSAESAKTEDLKEIPPLTKEYAALKGAANDPNRDYLAPLYRIQAQDPPNGRTLGELLHKASKAVSTGDQIACVRERQDHRILKRIYGLQYANHWSLRQMEPCPEPPTPKTHQDYLLDEMKWMRTDFRQERKIKKATAKYLAQQCAEWANAKGTDRLELQVKIKPRVAQDVQIQQIGVPHSPAATNGGNGEVQSQGDDMPPDLESSEHDKSSPVDDIEMPSTPQFATVPASLFAAANVTDMSQHLLESKEFADIIQELPLYIPFSDDMDLTNAPSPAPRPRPVPAVSKFCNSKIVAKVPAPSRKRSRYDYEDEDEITVEPKPKRLRASDETSGVVPEQTDVALFDPENKHIKDRLHANTAFRPPSEFPMPSAQFYEFRSASQWTWEDDQELRKLAKDFSFNWSLIAEKMELPSGMHGAAERRTPWECFERWVELETLPNEMRKTVYFRTWGQRMENASRNVEARYQAQLQLHSQTSVTGPPPNRRRTQPARVEKRRNARYLHLVEAMRKLARKREQQQHKQAEAQKAASLRKQHESVAPKSNMHTPQEFSKLRQERDLQIAARQERYREQVLAQQKLAHMQRTGQHPNQQQTMAAAQQNRQGAANVMQGHSGSIQPGGQSQQQVNGQPLHQGQQQGLPVQTRNGHLAVPQMGNMQGNIPQAQMQPNMRGGSTGPNHGSDNLQRMAMQAQFKNPQMQNQQYPMQHQQQHSSPGGHHGPNGMISNQVSNNQAIMTTMQGVHGNQNTNNQVPAQQHHGNHVNGNANASMSPHMPPPATPSSQPQQLSSGHVPAINQLKHSLQAQHPQATAQQVEQMASEHMRKQLQAAQARQNAINAASGSHGVISNSSSYNQNQNQTAYQQNQQANANNHHNYSGQNNMPPNNVQSNNIQSSNLQTNNLQAGNVQQGNNSSPQQQQYSALMRQRLMQQQQALQTQGPPSNSSPQMQRASPAVMHASPNMQQAVPNMTGVTMNGQRQGATPQMVRIPSSGGMPSPGLPQGSPRTGMVRQ